VLLMTENQGVEKYTGIIAALIFVAVFLGVMVLAVFVTLTALQGANTSTNSTTIYEEAGYLNQSTYTLDKASLADTSAFTVLTIVNATSHVLVPAVNYTATSAGVLANSSVDTWPTVLINYTYTTDSSDDDVSNIAIVEIQDNTIAMVVNFFALAPTIGTIMGILILIVGLVVLVTYILRLRSQNQSTEQVYTG